jgi:hypothetical protein
MKFFMSVAMAVAGLSIAVMARAQSSQATFSCAVKYCSQSINGVEVQCDDIAAEQFLLTIVSDDTVHLQGFSKKSGSFSVDLPRVQKLFPTDQREIMSPFFWNDLHNVVVETEPGAWSPDSSPHWIDFGNFQGNYHHTRVSYFCK